MKKVLSLVGIFVFVICAQSAVFGQQKISESKQKLISELLGVTGSQKQTMTLMNSMLDSQESVYLKLIESRFADRDLSDAKKAELTTLAKDTYKRVSQKMRIRINELDLENFFNEISFEIYDKYFTEDDLAVMVRFYSSDAGKKLLANTNNIFLDSMKATEEKLLPSLIKIAKEVMNEEMNSAYQEIERSLET